MTKKIKRLIKNSERIQIICSEGHIYETSPKELDLDIELCPICKEDEESWKPSNYDLNQMIKIIRNTKINDILLSLHGFYYREKRNNVIVFLADKIFKDISFRKEQYMEFEYSRYKKIFNMLNFNLREATSDEIKEMVLDLKSNNKYKDIKNAILIEKFSKKINIIK